MLTVVSHWCGNTTQVEVKQSHYRPVQAPGLQEVEAPRIFRQSAHEDVTVVSPTHRPPLSPRRYSWYSFLLRGWVDPRAIVRREGLSQWIEPATFRLVAQCLNQLHHRVPPVQQKYCSISATLIHGITIHVYLHYLSFILWLRLILRPSVLGSRVVW
jgi:hypothetical protein